MTTWGCFEIEAKKGHSIKCKTKDHFKSSDVYTVYHISYCLVE